MRGVHSFVILLRGARKIEPARRERMSVDLELLVELHRRIPPIVRMFSGAAASRR